MQTLTKQFDNFTSEAISKAKQALEKLGGRFVLPAPITLHIDTCDGNGFIYELQARHAVLRDGVLYIVKDIPAEEVDAVIDNAELAAPEDLWTLGGEWYAEWEGLLEVFDTLIDAASGVDTEKGVTVVEFSCPSDIGQINDSMQLDSGQELITLAGYVDGKTVTVSVKVHGEVRVIFRDQVYKAASQMPKELLDCYAKGKNPEQVALSDGKQYETPYYCDNNNWLEEDITIFGPVSIIKETSDVVDVPEDNSYEGWKKVLIEDIIEFQKS